MESAPSPDSVALGRVSTVEAVEAAIRSEVLNGDIRPGEQLRELDLANRYRVGRNSVRAAFQALAMSGLLRHEQNRGVFVPRLTVSDISDIYHLRRAIESEAVSTAIRIAADLSVVEAAAQQLERLESGATWMTAVELDLRLHTELVAAAASPRMSRIYGGILSEQRLLLAQVGRIYPEHTVLGPMHRAIVDALHDRDEVRALVGLREHLEASAVEAIEVMTDRGDR